ncbi:hypothetical protein D1007_35106 [Hordeum vulgare]|nr:hypothetical protein D1007_35106 [Hordeum vulgare]
MDADGEAEQRSKITHQGDTIQQPESSKVPGTLHRLLLDDEVAPNMHNMRGINEDCMSNNNPLQIDERAHLFLGASTSHFTQTSTNQSPGMQIMNMTSDAPMSYLQMMFAADQEGAKYALSQSQEDRLLRTENELFMITGRYGTVTSEDPMQTNAQTIADTSEVDNNQCQEQFPEYPNFESLQDLNFDNEQPDEAV